MLREVLQQQYQRSPFWQPRGKQRRLNEKENGVSAPLRHFKQELDLKESTVRGWVTTYQNRLDSLRKEGKPLTVSVLSEKSRGRPLLVGSEVDGPIEKFLGSGELIHCKGSCQRHYFGQGCQFPRRE